MKRELQLEPLGERDPSDADPLLENQQTSDVSIASSSSSEIQDEDVENGSVPCCRICLECDGEPEISRIGDVSWPPASWEIWMTLVTGISKHKGCVAMIQCIQGGGVPYTLEKGQDSRVIRLLNDGPCMTGSRSSQLFLVIGDDELISPCMCKGTQQFVHRSCLDHWRSVKEGFAFSHCTTCKAQFHLRVALFEENSWRQIKFRLFVARDVFFVFLAVQTVIAAMGGFAYLMDKDGAFRNSFSDGWDRILSKHPIPFYYCIGVMVFFVLLGFFGLILHCSSLNTNDPRMAGCQNCCYGWGILDCFPASMEACFALVIVFVVIFAILGIAYGFLAATMAIQKIWQKHYHILTKRELTKEYIVEDLHGSYAPPKLDTEHEEHLRALKLL
ncbi:hypothetical protein JRO89_XS04G0241900 [Xanthoceras sorbifolium]|uniref:RING-CH-type domain-containing protein n=1 Tax=Xanthoceras sorbifolium TaxID=99658 RepID=A0ABQ8I719_9ROSI|nr:hypothetical protein JRO89_XS04G0241900 [Xanthoceras sorbifolium]